MKVSVSFLKRLTSLEDTIKDISKTDADYVHVDIMDGIFVKNKSDDESELLPVLKSTDKLFDVHLMVENPRPYIMTYADLRTLYLTFHVEVNDNIEELIMLIHSLGIRAGLAINPDTKLAKLEPYLGMIDYVLVMGVMPGVGGQEMIPETVERVNKLAEVRDNYNYHYVISFDGGVKDTTRKQLDKADIVVAGSYICTKENFQEQINTLR